MREPEEDELYAVRNISLNSHDRRGQKKYFPHAYANLVTREDVCFFERNAIDGICNNEGHGAYPYHSWAGGIYAALSEPFCETVLKCFKNLWCAREI